MRTFCRCAPADTDSPSQFVRRAFWRDCRRPRCPYFRSELFHCRRKGGTECFAIPGENQDHAVFDNDLCAIVHPSGTATVLVALGASLKLKGPRGERTLPIEQFFVRPQQDVTRENVLHAGELIVEVRVPIGQRSEYVKLMQKQTFDWPLADAAVAFDLDSGSLRDPRVVLGAAAPVPWRAKAAENALAGKKLRRERSASTLQATALVHEAYLRLVDHTVPAQWDGRWHFFAAAAEAMRRILVENARRRGRLTDQVVRWSSLLLFSLPLFWLGLIAILLFSYVWPILPASHMRSVDAAEMSEGYVTSTSSRLPKTNCPQRRCSLYVRKSSVAARCASWFARSTSPSSARPSEAKMISTRRSASATSDTR